jgi:NADPH:quinone reductase-like Zn-dependent oxidoreductase
MVEAAGSGLMGKLMLGRRVAVINGAGGNWAQYAVIPAIHAVAVPSDLPLEQVACFFVNPATVLVMARHVLRIRNGEWLLQTAAGSALGRMMIRLARHDGFRTINVVRRQETAEQLRALGADAVIDTSSESLEQRVKQLTDGKGVRHAIDAVGGATGSEVVRCLGTGGRLLLYGTLSMEPLQFDQRILIAGSKCVEGFWLSDWSRAHPLRMVGLFRSIARLIRKGVLTSEIAETLPLDQVTTAVNKAVQPGRTGKILLGLGV